MKSSASLRGKIVFVTGGSGGLGKAISQALAAKGAHVTIFARREGPLADAKSEIQKFISEPSQEIRAVAIDLSDASKVDEAFRAQPRMADALYCVAGGNHAENGFLVDIKASDLENCMRNNYYSAAFPAKALLNIWTEDDAKKASGAPRANPRLRQIVFVSSAAAFLGLPGSIAYTRFYLEQDTKTPLTKRMQGTDCSIAELESRYPTSAKVASQIIAAVGNGEFIICKDSMAASLLFTNMIGPSPKRGLGIADSLLGWLVGWFVWPVLRRRWEAMCREDGEELGRVRGQ
ncbi:NAD(P)-binding domain protein [Tolypocladium capitatum]|uniref:NAD(P)-binding domain protein n=1 Tax=Tolypocladium capitatum TaxID=45235 RepID=A0A2K3QGQ7_9HYPO|nr:NAD(P)-binding domain protein [Tolypocladium capitatum]